MKGGGLLQAGVKPSSDILARFGIMILPLLKERRRRSGCARSQGSPNGAGASEVVM